MKQSMFASLGAATLVVLGAGSAAAQNMQPIPQDGQAQMREEAAARDNARKQELASTILAARESAAHRQFSDRLRGILTQKLLSASVASLEAFANAGGLGNMDLLVPNALGDSAADLVFTPVTPCRIVNTVATATPLSANSNRAFYVNGNAAGVFEAQGGNAGGCGIPDSATAVEMNFIAVGPAAAGDFRAFPWASGTPAPPLASVINYANVGALNIANGIAQPVCNAATTTCTFDLFVQADAGASHLIIDVVGYYAKVDKAQVRTFVVSKATSYLGDVVVSNAGTCTNFPAANITVVAPVAGKVVLHANVSMLIPHTTGTNSYTELHFGTTATQCTQVYGYKHWASVRPNEETELYYPAVNISASYDVPAGSTTFYVNGIKLSGAGTHAFQFAYVDATFIPN